MRKKHGNDPTIYIDTQNTSFSCKIPLYEYSSVGRPIVKIWDCKTQRTLVYTQDEWERKQREEGV